MKKEDLINEVMENKEKEYKVGQRVKVISGANISGFNGLEGFIEHIDKEAIKQPHLLVRFDNEISVYCYPFKDYPFEIEILEDNKYQVGDLVYLESGIISTITSLDNTKQIKTAKVIDGSRKDVYTINQSFIVSHIKPAKDTRKYPLTPDECFAKEVDNNNKLIRRFPTGAVRSNDTGRIRPDWISPYFAEEVSKVLIDNENDFGGSNYLLGIPELACLASLIRHVGELQEALLITKDNESARVIARAVGFNIVSMIHTMVLKEKGLYNELYEGTELVTVEEAKKGSTYVKK